MPADFDWRTEEEHESTWEPSQHDEAPRGRQPRIIPLIIVLVTVALFDRLDSFFDQTLRIRF